MICNDLLLVIFVAGFAGSFHCIGNVRRLCCALGRDPRGGAATVERHLLYKWAALQPTASWGRLAAPLGQVVSPRMRGWPPLTASSTPPIAPGDCRRGPYDRHALQFFGLFAWLPSAPRWFRGSSLAMSLRRLLAARSRAPRSPLRVQRLLPCPLVYAFAAQAGSTAAPLPGFRSCWPSAWGPSRRC